MIYSSKFCCGYLINFSTDGFYKVEVLDGWIDGDVFLRLYGVVDIDTDDSLCPLFELRHFLTRELVSASCDMDSTIFIDNKLGVFKTPTIYFKPLLFIFNGLAGFDWLKGEGEMVGELI
jgi:hypothetical protein